MSLDLAQAMRDTVREVVREEIRAALKEFGARQPEAAPLDVLGVDDVVRICNGNVTAPTVRVWCRSGRLIAKKAGRSYLIERSALTRFLSTLQVAERRDVTPEQDAARILAKVRR